MHVQSWLGRTQAIPHPGTLLTVPNAFDEVLSTIRTNCKPDAPTHKGFFEHGSSSEQVAKSVQVKVLCDESYAVEILTITFIYRN